EKGPHLYEFSPSGNCLEYFAMSIGARSQSAKTYLEAHFNEFAECDLPTLIKHGLHALRDTLQQDKELTIHNTSVGIVGVSPLSASAPPSTSTEAPSSSTLGPEPSAGTLGGAFDKFRIVEGEDLTPYLESMDPKDRDDEPVPTRETTGVAGEAPAGEGQPTQSAGDEMQTD
ncbi:hypothetical protein JCM21900_001681, partial [Sporobolomyces salmonicolor]